MKQFGVPMDSLGGRYMPYVLVFIAVGSNVSVAMTSIGIGIGALVMCMDCIRRRAFPPIDRWLGLVILLYIGTSFFIAAMSNEPEISLNEAGSEAIRILPFVFAAGYLRSRRMIAAVLGAFSLSVFFNDLVATIQFLSQEDCGWGVGRPIGTVKSPTFLGSFMLMALPVLMLLPRVLPISRLEKKVLWGVGIVSFFVLIISGTRGAWLSFVVTSLLGAVLAWSYLSAYKKQFICSMALAGILIFCVHPLQSRMISIFDNNYHSNTERILMWEAAVAIWQDHPVLGIGQSEFGLIYNRDYISPLAKERPVDADHPRTGHGHPHNNFLKVLSERGLFGMFFFLLLHGCFLFHFLRLWKTEKGKEQSIFALCGIMVFLGIHLEGMTDTNIVLTHITRTYWLLLGVCLSGTMIREKRCEFE